MKANDVCYKIISILTQVRIKLACWPIDVLTSKLPLSTEQMLFSISSYHEIANSMAHSFFVQCAYIVNAII